MKKEMQIKILCVDDDRRNLKLLQAFLEPERYSVELCESGEEALKKVDIGIPDLILLDVIMPSISGIDILKKLRDNERTRLIPVILLTALRESEDRIRGIESDCDDFISKPFDRAELLARIRSLLRLGYYRNQLNEKEKFLAVVNDMSDGVIVFSPGWKILDINISAKKYFCIDSLDNFDFIGNIFRNFSIPLSREELFDTSVLHRDFIIIKSETEMVQASYFEVRLDVLKNPLGELVNIVWVVRDVTEARKDEISKQNFLKFISHKLRLPLTVILEGLGVLKDEIPGLLNEKQKEVLFVASRKAIHLSLMIGRLIKFTAIARRGLCDKKEAVDLKVYIPALMQPIIEVEKDKRIEINIECEGDACIVSLCRENFDLIMENLIENAIKFNDNQVIKIGIKAVIVSGRFEFSVSDNGRGIALEQQDKIFQKFYQAEKYFTGQVEGIGLGLALVKDLVERSKGEIRFVSEPGRGTTFTFTIG